jgi:hypothetical protein
MLHTVISTNRSGSNVLCRYIAKKFNTVNLYEPVTDSRDENGCLTIDVDKIIYDLIDRSTKENIVAKFHIDHLLLLYPKNSNAIVDLLKASKKYYSLRSSLAQQIISIHAIKNTDTCDIRSKKIDFLITGENARDIAVPLIFYISVMGEWYKQFPGKLIILEDMSDAYVKEGFEKYSDVYKFKFDNEQTRKFVEQSLNANEYFIQGNKFFSLIGD